MTKAARAMTARADTERLGVARAQWQAPLFSGTRRKQEQHLLVFVCCARARSCLVGSRLHLQTKRSCLQRLPARQATHPLHPS